MPDAGYLTIGKVVKKLQPQYPDLSVSKVRFLEDEGLLTPSRTPGGYRLYSPADVRRLETILHLQKARFMPLSVIKEELERGAGTPAGGDSLTISVASATLPELGADDAQTVSRLHPIDRVPEQLGVSVTFLKQLDEAGVIRLRRSPAGRDLVDGHDFALIRTCEELRRYGIGPKNLRQYVQAANRESGMFEQALIVFARKGGGVRLEVNDETRQQFTGALAQMLALTNQVRDALVTRQIQQSFREMGESGSASRDEGEPAQQRAARHAPSSVSSRRRTWGRR